MTHLRQAMLEELQRRNYATTTVYYYLKAVEQFAKVLPHVAGSTQSEPPAARIRRTCCASGSSGRGRSSSTSPRSGSSS